MNIVGTTGSRAIAVALTIGLMLLALPSPAWAQDSPRADQPNAQDYYFAEFMGGSIGGLVGVSALEQYFAYFCADVDDSQLCWTTFRTVYRPIGYPLLVFLGSSVGIATAGSLAGVQGSLTATLIGTFIGAFGGMVTASGLWLNLISPLFEPGAAEELVAPEETPEYLKRTFPLLMRVLSPHEKTIRNTVYITFPVMFASYFGTEGYNIGAQLTEPPVP